MFDAIGKKCFMLHHVSFYQQPVLLKTYQAEEFEFKKSISVLPKAFRLQDSNVISSHVIHNVKVNDDDSLKMQERISPHGNEDSIKAKL